MYNTICCLTVCHVPPPPGALTPRLTPRMGTGGGQTPGQTPLRDKLNINPEDAFVDMDGIQSVKQQQVCSIYIYFCKSGNICGALIFTNFAQNSRSANSKTRENICDTFYAHFGHVGVVY